MATLASRTTSVPSSGAVSTSALLFSKIRPSSKVITTRSFRSGTLRARTTITAAAYRVTLITPEGDKVVHVSEDECILDAAEKQGIDMPYFCRSGGLLFLCRTSEVRNSETG